MTGSPIDAAIRSTETPSASIGNLVPDSKAILAEIPQLIMNPTTERLNLKFQDGLGLTDDYGNVYDGYNGTSSSVIWTNNPTESLQVGTGNSSGVPDPDAATGNTVVYDEETGQYRSVVNIDYVMFIIEKPTNRDYPFALELPFGVTIIPELCSYEIESGSGAVTFPSGDIESGELAFITVTGTTSTSEFLKAQVGFSKNILPSE